MRPSCRASSKGASRPNENFVIRVSGVFFLIKRATNITGQGIGGIKLYSQSKEDREMRLYAVFFDSIYSKIKFSVCELDDFAAFADF